MKSTLSADIIIIGAGAAGLMAARELSRHFSVLILEARSLPGGRIRTTYQQRGAGHIEQGAEFVHGRLPLTLSLLKEAGLSYSPVQGEMFHIENGRWEQPGGNVAGWDVFIEKMKNETADTTLLSFLQQHFGDEKYAALRSYVSRFAEGFDLADISRVSIKSLLDEWSHEMNENYRVDKGYMALIRFPETACVNAGCRFVYDAPVKLIEWHVDGVKAYIGPEIIYEAKKILLTIPLGILQSREAVDAIRFVPAIDAYLDAAQQMGYGSVIKFVLTFTRAFWKDDHPSAGFMISDEKVPTWWTQNGEQAVLTGWLGGASADEWINSTDEQLLSMGLHSLSAIFGLSYGELRSMLTGSHVYNWAHDQWADGGYSYTTPGTAAALALFKQPPGGVVYFAGEAFYEGASPGTVEAALQSGQSAAGYLSKVLV